MRSRSSSFFYQIICYQIVVQETENRRLLHFLFQPVNPLLRGLLLYFLGAVEAHVALVDIVWRRICSRVDDGCLQSVEELTCSIALDAAVEETLHDLGAGPALDFAGVTTKKAPPALRLLQSWAPRTSALHPIFRIVANSVKTKSIWTLILLFCAASLPLAQDSSARSSPKRRMTPATPGSSPPSQSVVTSPGRFRGWRVAQAFDFIEVTNAVGAPSFA
jgi:hypothetical protein